MRRAHHLLLLAAAVVLGACSKTVAVELTIVEPCDQKAQALGGASSFAVSSSGSEVDSVVVFSDGQGSQPLNVGLGEEVIVTVQAFADDVSGAGAASALPQAVGHTMPLQITEQSLDVKALVPVGLLDSFGRTTNAEGECTAMTQGAPVAGRHGHTATFVPGLNQVLLYGGAVFGSDGSENILPGSAELWDPATGEYTPVGGATARAYHAATALPDGRVVISGGFGIISGSMQTLQTADIFDPLTKSFRSILLRQARAHHTSTLMEGSSLLVIAGGCLSTGPADACTRTQAGRGNRGPSTALAVTMETLDIDDLAAATLAVPNQNGLATPRAFHEATSLENGSNTLLIVTGGVDDTGTIEDIEVFRANGGILTREVTGNLAGFPSGKGPARHAAVAIDAQRLLVIGGQTQAPQGVPSGPGTPDVFIFSTVGGIDPTAIPLFNGSGRAGHRAARLRDNTILVVGGSIGPNGPTAEVLAPAPGTGILTARVIAGPLGASRERAALALLPNNQVLFTGGHTIATPFTSSSSAELYFGN
jgi:large repetitive protein